MCCYLMERRSVFASCMRTIGLIGKYRKINTDALDLKCDILFKSLFGIVSFMARFFLQMFHPIEGIKKKTVFLDVQ